MEPPVTGGLYCAIILVMKKSIAPHITALLSGAVTVLTVLHPGFKIPTVVESLVASLTALASVALEAFHFAKKHSLQQNLALATHFANQLTTAVQSDVAPAVAPSATTDVAPKA